jgi:hypothetical protein
MAGGSKLHEGSMQMNIGDCLMTAANHWKHEIKQAFHTPSLERAGKIGLSQSLLSLKHGHTFKAWLTSSSDI